MAHTYTSTVYGDLPTQNWRAYRAAVLRQEAENWHRVTRDTEPRQETVQAISDISTGATWPV